MNYSYSHHESLARNGGPYSALHQRIANLIHWPVTSGREQLARRETAHYLIGAVHDAVLLGLTPEEVTLLTRMLDGDNIIGLTANFGIRPSWDSPGLILSSVQAKELRKMLDLANNLGATKVDLAIGESRNKLPIRVWSSPAGQLAVREVAIDRLGFCKSAESYTNIGDFVTAYKLED